MMSVTGFMRGLANATESFRKNYAGKIGTAIGEKAVDILNTGINTGTKVGAKAYAMGATGVAKGIKTYTKHEDDIKRVGKAWGDKIQNFSAKETGKAIWNGIPGDMIRGTTKEAGVIGVTAIKGLEQTDRALQKMKIWKATDLDDSFIGRKLTPGGVGLLTAGAMAINAGKGAKESLDRRQGRNDGRIYSPTPTMTNPYLVANQMMGTQIGQSFANNGGADGDLVKAVHNMR